MWIIGGGDTEEYAHDVWSSTDGRIWTLEASGLAWLNSSVITVLNGSLWIVDTWDHPGTVWNSPDGVNWTQVAAGAQWAPRLACLVVAFQDKLWILGGSDAETQQTYYNDIWNSPDGLHWNQVGAGGTAWGPRVPHGTVFQNKLWVLGGAIFPLNGDTIWLHDAAYTFDGGTWEGVDADGVGYGNEFNVFDGQLWDMNRSYDTGGEWEYEQVYYRNEVWRSLDAAHWRQMPNAPWQERVSQQIVTFDGKAWVLGGILDDNNSLNDVWCLTPVLLTVNTGLGTRYKLGEDLTLTLSAGEPDGVVGYQWWKNGAAIPGATSDTYHVDHFTEKDAGTYFCELTGDGWGSSSPVQIGVLEPNMPAATPAGLAFGLTLAVAAVMLRKRKAVRRGIEGLER